MKTRLLMILAVGVLLVGCGNQQEANNPSTEQPSTSENTLTNEPTSTQTEPPHEHAYTEITTTEATCEADGVKTFTCDCGDSYTEVITATGHVYGDYVSNNDATYTADGTETATCVCGLTDTRTASGSKLEYTYTDLNKTMYAKSTVNIRNLPSTDGEKLGELTKAQEVTVTGQCTETGWYCINYNNDTGYVSSDYLVNDKPVEEPPAPKPDEPPYGETINVPGLPFVPLQIYDEGNIVYYWRSIYHYGNPEQVDQSNKLYEECLQLISERYDSYGWDNQYESYYYECSWGNTHKDGKAHICYDKFAFYAIE